MIPTLTFTILSALYDNGKRFVDHTHRFIFRAIVLGLISYFSAGNFLINFIQSVAIFYLLFDYVLNVIEGRKWNYIGDTAIHDIVWGKYLGGWIPQLIFKILLTITIKYL